MAKESIASSEAQKSYQRWVDELKADPAFQAIYEEEAIKSELWLQLAEAHQLASNLPFRIIKKR